jgi:hypothetical protein
LQQYAIAHADMSRYELIVFGIVTGLKFSSHPES